MTQSVTSMFDCTHGPKKDCHACIVGELVEALSELADEQALFAAQLPPIYENRLLRARAVLEKAKLIEDCIPSDEAEEASRT